MESMNISLPEPPQGTLWTARLPPAASAAQRANTCAELIRADEKREGARTAGVPCSWRLAGPVTELSDAEWKAIREDAPGSRQAAAARPSPDAGVRQSAAARLDLIVRVLHASSDWWGCWAWRPDHTMPDTAPTSLCAPNSPASMLARHPSKERWTAWPDPPLAEGQNQTLRCINALKAGSLPVDEVLARCQRNFE